MEGVVEAALLGYLADGHVRPREQRARAMDTKAHERLVRRQPELLAKDANQVALAPFRCAGEGVEGDVFGAPRAPMSEHEPKRGRQDRMLAGLAVRLGAGRSEHEHCDAVAQRAQSEPRRLSILREPQG